MSEEFNQVWNLQNEVRSHQNTLRMDFPQNTIYDYFEFKFNEHWILRHRNLFNRMLVEYYVALTTVNESERRQPWFDQLLKSIDNFVGFLNQHPD